MKIAVVVTSYPVFSETFIARELVGLESAGNELRVSALRRWPHSRPNTVHRALGARVDYLSLTSPANLVSLWHAWRSLRAGRQWNTAKQLLQHDSRLTGRRIAMTSLAKAMIWWSRNRGFVPDVIYAHWISQPAGVAQYMSCLVDVPWCCSAHARDVWTASPDVLRHRISGAARVLTCNSQALHKLRASSDEQAKLHLSHHGIDLQQFEPPPQTAPCTAPARDKTRTLQLLAVGRAVPKKGFAVLLQALAKLPRDLNWRLVHAGGGPGRYRLMWQAYRLGILGRTLWLGSVPSNRLLDHYRQADVFVQASLVDSRGDQDGLPNVLVEACSQGLASIATRLPSIADLIVHETNGLLVGPGNPDELAMAIERLARSPSLQKSLGQAAQQLVQSQFDCEESVAFVNSTLAAVAAGNGDPK